MPIPTELAPVQPNDTLPPPPPPAPRAIADSYAWRLLWTDGAAIVAMVFSLLGGIFTVVGIGLTLGIVTAFVGIPFFFLGIIMGGLGAVGLNWRYQQAQQIINVLRSGEPTKGQVVSVEKNLMVRVNGQRPWVIRYQFQLGGHTYQGQVSTLNSIALQPAQSVWVLYAPQTPTHNALYPHP